LQSILLILRVYISAKLKLYEKSKNDDNRVFDILVLYKLDYYYYYYYVKSLISAHHAGKQMMSNFLATPEMDGLLN